MEYSIDQARQNYEQAQRLLSLCGRAHSALRAAQEKLGSARNWGIADMLGGKLITNLVKHSRLDGAMEHIHQAKPMLEELGRELGRFQLPGDLQLQVGSFAVFADFFFDGIFADMYMQSKIRDLQYQVDDALSQLGRVRHVLEQVKAYEAARMR